MTVSAQVPSNSYTANGVTTVFPYTFKIVDADDLLILVDGVEPISGFTVSGVGVGSGGNVTFSVAPASASVIVVKRDMEITRETDYQEGGDLLAETLDADIDRTFLVMQQIDEEISRSITLPAGSASSGALPEIEANSYLIGNSAGNALEFVSATPGEPDPDVMADATLNGTERIALKQSGGWLRTTVQKISDFILTNPDGVTAGGVLLKLGKVTMTGNATTALQAVTKQQMDAMAALKADLVGGKVPAAQLPSYVDDVVESANLAAFPATGEASKIYVALDTGLIYRWSGSVYVQIGTNNAGTAWVFRAYSTAGTYTWTRPAGCVKVDVCVIGGAGSSQSASPDDIAGGAGGLSFKSYSAPSASYPITVGADGGYNLNQAGGASRFNTTQLGNGGASANNGGAGGAGAGGDIHVTGAAYSAYVAYLTVVANRSIPPGAFWTGAPEGAATPASPNTHGRVFIIEWY